MSDPANRCGLPRRLAAICYDSLLLLAVLFFAGILTLPFSSGQTLTTGTSNPLVTSYFFIVSYLFFGWFWTHGGQTLGMRAWKIRVQTFDGQGINWWQALFRFLCAILSWGVVGLGFFWQLVGKERLTWHDRFSETELVINQNQK